MDWEGLGTDGRSLLKEKSGRIGLHSAALTWGILGYIELTGYI